MDKQTKNTLFEAWAYCDHYDKSTEFMIEYMKSQANLEHDEVIDFLQETSDTERVKWYSNNPNWFEKYN